MQFAKDWYLDRHLITLTPNLWGEGPGMRGDTDSENHDTFCRIVQDCDPQEDALRMGNRCSSPPLLKNSGYV
jgi:hypothetical protein